MKAEAQKIYALQRQLRDLRKSRNRIKHGKQRHRLQKQIRGIQKELETLIDTATAPRDGVTRWWLRAALYKHLKRLALENKDTVFCSKP